MAHGVGSDLEDITAILVLGAGFVALFLGFDWFWMAWILGFVVVLPLVDVLTPDDDAAVATANDDAVDAETESTRDALETLRERYARGELTDEQFERKLDRLLETETPEDAAERLAERERE